jgi:type 1 fimbria pilin
VNNHKKICLSIALCLSGVFFLAVESHASEINFYGRVVSPGCLSGERFNKVILSCADNPVFTPVVRLKNLNEGTIRYTGFTVKIKDINSAHSMKVVIVDYL